MTRLCQATRAGASQCWRHAGGRSAQRDTRVRAPLSCTSGKPLRTTAAPLACERLRLQRGRARRGGASAAHRRSRRAAASGQAVGRRLGFRPPALPPRRALVRARVGPHAAGDDRGLSAVALDDRAARLISMANALEEGITRLEEQGGEEATETARRLRSLQTEILMALYHLEGDPPA